VAVLAGTTDAAESGLQPFQRAQLDGGAELGGFTMNLFEASLNLTLCDQTSGRALVLPALSDPSTNPSQGSLDMNSTMTVVDDNYLGYCRDAFLVIR
jgi:hypothetical protein